MEQQKQREKKQIESNARIKRFREKVKYGRIFECICCHRRLFEQQVSKIQDEKKFEHELEKNFPGLFMKAIGEIVTRRAPDKVSGNFYICITCRDKLKKGNFPPMSHKNHLEIVDTSKHPELDLNEVENSLIARNLIFQKIYLLPKSRSPAFKDRLVNIPIYESTVIQSVESLPRTPSEAAVLPVKLKRKKEYKNSHKIEYVSVPKVFKALKTLKEMGNPYYQFVPDFESYQNKCKNTDAEGFKFLFPDQAEKEHVSEVQENEGNYHQSSFETEDIETEDIENEFIRKMGQQSAILDLSKGLINFQENCTKAGVEGFNFLLTDQAENEHFLDVQENDDQSADEDVHWKALQCSALDISRALSKFMENSTKEDMEILQHEHAKMKESEEYDDSLFSWLHFFKDHFDWVVKDSPTKDLFDQDTEISELPVEKDIGDHTENQVNNVNNENIDLNQFKVDNCSAENIQEKVQEYVSARIKNIDAEIEMYRIYRDANREESDEDDSSEMDEDDTRDYLIEQLIDEVNELTASFGGMQIILE